MPEPPLTDEDCGVDIQTAVDAKTDWSADAAAVKVRFAAKSLPTVRCTNWFYTVRP